MPNETASTVAQENQTPEEVVANEAIAFKNPFLIDFDYKPPEPIKPLTMVPQISGVEYDKDTGTAHAVIDHFDIDEYVQQTKDECGLEYFLKQIKAGQARPEDSYDDGKAVYESDLVPETIHESAKISDALNDQIGKLCKSLGVDPEQPISGKQLVALLQQQVDKNEAAKAAAQTAPEETK